MNASFPSPSLDLLSFISGFGEVLQQIPFEIIAAPPLSVMFPPLAAVFCVTSMMSVIVTMALLHY